MQPIIRFFFALSIIGVFSGLVFAQDKYTAPINWEIYQISDLKLSIQLPKLPIRNDSNNICFEIDARQYWVYAANVAYGLKIISKTKSKIPIWCSESRRFNRAMFDSRRKELGQSATQIPNTDPLIEQWNTQYGSRLEKRWLIDDLNHNRWLELTVTGIGESFAKEQEFLESLKLDKADKGIEIGDGATQTLGDKNVTETMPSSSSAVVNAETTKKEVTEPLIIVAKVKAKYSDAARSHNVQGTVTIRVTFLSNGGIGDISVVKGLPYGLTEQAVAAARKIVFFPEKANGVARHVSRPVTFSFNIY